MAIQADPLSWGQGPIAFEMFLEPTCPFSGKAFNKLDELLEKAGPDRITVKIRLQSQPWHMYSAVVIRAVLAASTLPGGKDAARKVLQAVADHRDEFEFDKHCAGANMDVTPARLLKRIEDYAGVKLADAFARPELNNEVKWHVKYARQNGVHMSPSFMIGGLLVPGMSSGDSVEDWISNLPA